MKKTKIIGTIGPSTQSKEMMEKLILTGIDVVRINMSHANHEEAARIINTIRELNRELNTNVGILIDTMGPELRLENYSNERVKIEKDDEIILTINNDLKDNGKFGLVGLTSIEDIEIGHKVFLDDGLIELVVSDISLDDLICKAINCGTIRDKMRVTVPGIVINNNFLSSNDKEDVVFASKMEADFIALSFVRNANDVLDVNDILIGLKDEHMQIISKIENESAVNDIDDIIKVSDGIMVARGDLGIEIELERVPSVQKSIVGKCSQAEKICIVATQMLLSMQHNTRPTRAEASDVANAVIDGADAVMLSEETAVGNYPIETVKTMVKIIENIEESLDYMQILKNKKIDNNCDMTTIIAHNVAETSDLIKTKAIVVSTMSGYTARMVSKFRPSSIIIATTPYVKTARSLSLNSGVIPVVVPMFESTDKIVSNAVDIVKEKLSITEGKIIITGGFPINDNRETNFMKIEEIENPR